MPPPLPLPLLLLLLLTLPFTLSQYLNDVYKYTGCSSDDCSNSKCMAGYRKNTDWQHFG